MYCEGLSTFTAAIFTNDEQHVVAARDTYLGVWCASSGTLQRIFQVTLTFMMC